MKPSKISVQVGRTFNTGNYTSLKLAYEMEVQLDEGDKPSETIDKARDYLAAKLKEDKDKLIKK